MEMEYKDPSKRGRWIVVIGVVLAIAAGGAAFFLINQAQQQAGQGGLQKVAVVVAVRPIQARIPIVAEDVTVREVPIDPTNAQGIISTPDKAIGHVLSVAVLQDQMITTNLFATESSGGFSSLEPGQTGPSARVRRPGADPRRATAAAYGETTKKVIAKYGLPIPEVSPPGRGPIPTPAPTPIATPAPSGSPAPSTGP